jgi:ABC-type molybdenum transport system ATPase subunit/photorepair protein PhrA
MFFEYRTVKFKPPRLPHSQIYLIEDKWDDWGKFQTQFTLTYVNEKSELEYIGAVKIGQFDMVPGQRMPNIPESFDQLDTRFFSLGQDVDFYENLNKYGEDFRYKVLSGLNDVALDEELFERALSVYVTGESLLRHVNRTSVRGRFRRLARGDASLTHYKFKYSMSKADDDEFASPELSFEVKPGSNPPTNIHTIIGRNGVGKTRLINKIIKSLIYKHSQNEDFGEFSSELLMDSQDLFANLVSVTFSAFDGSEAVTERKDNSTGMRYSYIGLKQLKVLEDQDVSPKSKSQEEDEDEIHSPKSLGMLNKEFVDSLKVCVNGAKADRWIRAVKMLEADPLFKEIGVSKLIRIKNKKIFNTTARLLFKKLSSGHKIVLLTITKLVEKVEERTLVLLDEPEAHLHPPLLSAFTRALSDLLIYRNGVGIIATHSPVVLQEVPKSCVWIMRRSNTEVVMERPERETFGENIGSLTREVFGLEVTQSGFHKMLSDAVDSEEDYDAVLEYFNQELGMEARAILRALIVNN